MLSIQLVMPWMSCFGPLLFFRWIMNFVMEFSILKTNIGEDMLWWFLFHDNLNLQWPYIQKKWSSDTILIHTYHSSTWLLNNRRTYKIQKRYISQLFHQFSFGWIGRVSPFGHPNPTPTLTHSQHWIHI